MKDAIARDGVGRAHVNPKLTRATHVCIAHLLINCLLLLVTTL